jgi:ZIP family zinc transporter
MSTLTLGLILALFAASSTILGWVLIAARKQVSERFLAFTLLLVAGAMITVSLVQILPSSIRAIDSVAEALLWFFIGVFLIWLLTRINFVADSQSKVAQSAFLIAFAIGLHNL